MTYHYDTTGRVCYLMQDITMLQKEILRLKKQKNAFILAHNYQRPEIQDIADVIGDSLELARAAVGKKGDIIVFCGVDFMAETAAILSPEKTVLLPATDACCPMAGMVSSDESGSHVPATPMQRSSVTSTRQQTSRRRAISAAPRQTR